MAIKTLGFSFAVALSLGVLSTTAVALPQIGQLSFESANNPQGEPRCGDGQLVIDYQAEEGDTTPWGIRILKNGVMAYESSLSEVHVESPFRYGHHYLGKTISGLSHNYQAQIFSETDGGEVVELTAEGIPCLGDEPDGKGHIYTQFAFVTFSDFAHIPPFTPAQFEQEILVSTDRAGRTYSLSDIFEANSYGKVDVKTTIYDWVTLPKTMEEYCSTTMHQPSYRDLVLGYNCDLNSIYSDSMSILQAQGVKRDSTVFNLIINGMGATGFGEKYTGRTYMGADALLNELDKDINANRSWTLAHEIGHALSLAHANDLENCVNGFTPTTFMSGQDATECDIVRYGVSTMGGADPYAGFNAAQRLKLGFLDSNQVLKGDASVSQTYMLSDLDDADQQTKLVLLKSDKLPKQYQLFLEYSKDDYAFQFDRTEYTGVRVGLFDDRYNFYSNGRLAFDGDAIYFSDVSLNAAGDTIAIEALGIEITLVEKSGNEAEVSVVPMAPVCEDITATNSEHAAVGRAYSETTTEGETCYGTWCFGGTEVTTWYVEGSDENLGTDGNTTTTLHEESEGVFAQGVCPGPDLTAPVIILLGDNPVTVHQGSIFTDAGATAEDNIDGDLTAAIAVIGSVDTNTIGTYQLTYIVSDAAGNTATEVRTVEIIAVPACQEFTDTVANHETAGRAYSQTETTGETCYGTFCWGGTTTTVWYAQGSDENLGTNGSASVTLKTSANGYVTGNCPTDPQPPVIESYEISQLSYNSAVVTGIASDPDGDIDRVVLGLGAISGIICEGTTNFTCTIDYSVHNIDVGVPLAVSLAAWDSRDVRSTEIEHFTITRPEQQASVPPVITNLDYTVSGQSMLVTVDVTDQDSDLAGVRLEYSDQIGQIECDNTGGSQYTCDLTSHGLGTYNFKVAAYDLAGNMSETAPFTVEFIEVGECITDTNFNHVEAGRAYVGGLSNLYAYGVGSSDDLGLYGSTYYSATTSVEETSAGVWTKVDNCQ